MTDLAAAMGAPPPATQPAEPPKKKRASGRRGVARKGQGKGKKRKPVKKAAPAEGKRGRGRPPGTGTMLSLDTALQLANSVKRTDMQLFQQMVAALNGKSRASRRQILDALDKVFS